MSFRPDATATAAAMQAALDEFADAERAAGSARFFKTGPGRYGEGDVFIGVTVPATRAIVKRFERMPLAEASALLESPVHEHRLAALLVMVRQFQLAGRPRARDDRARATLHEAYLGDAGPILRLAPRLLDDREDLMHKAVGWMLRELGKRVDRSQLIAFLDEYAPRMPRTMLSYATEHLAPEARAAYRARR